MSSVEADFAYRHELRSNSARLHHVGGFGAGREILWSVGVWVAGLSCLLAVFWAPQLASAQVTLSGTLYTNAGVTVETATRTIAVAVGTSTPGRFSTTSTITTGVWSITIPTGHGIGTGTPIMIWIDGAAVDGSLLTKASTSNDVSSITGLDIYRDRLIVRHEATSGTSTTNADLSFITSTQDSDLQHSTTTGGIIVRTGTELYVWTGDTFAPGGTVTIAGNAGSGVDGSFFLANSSTYIGGGTLSLAGSLSAVSGVTYTPGLHTTTFIATTTGKTINAPVTTLGNVTFNGVGGEWAFTSTNATTSDLYVTNGTVSAPSGTLGVTGVFQNNATFDNNNGTLHLQGIVLSDVIPYIAGRDQSASATSTGNLAINRFAVVGNIMYVAKAGSATACVQTSTGGASGCELMMYDISSTTNPVYVAGLDASGNATGTGNLAITALEVVGNYLYVGKAGSATACSQIVGSADGCELMVYDISSTTNPVYVAGRDTSGDAISTSSVAITSITATGSILYVTKAANGTACSQIAGFAVGCDLMLFDISSTTNPVYVGGVDTSGSINGTEVRAFNFATVIGSYVYAYKLGSTGGCAQSAPTVGCELMVFDFSSTTNAVYVSGRDGSGVGGFNNEDYFASAVVGNTLYLGKEFTAGACSLSTGVGCELIMYDISNAAFPRYIGGRDSNGSSVDGSGAISIVTLVTQGNTLYAGKAGSATACGQTPGSALGCELMVFDISSTTNPQFMFGRDASGDAVGTTSVTVNNLRLVNNTLYVAKAGSATACSQTTGLAVGCELMIFDASSTQPTGIMYGNLNGSSQLNDVVATGPAAIRSVASTSDVTINTSSSLTMPSLLTVSGQYSNSGRAEFQPDAVTVFESNSSQNISGALSGSSTLNNLIFRGSGTKTFASQASATSLMIESGVTVVAPNPLTLRGDLVNEGTLTSSGGGLILQSIVPSFVSGIDTSGSATGTNTAVIYDMVAFGTTLVVANSPSTTPCSQVPGSAAGCEVQIYDISDITKPVFLAGRDVSGSATGTGALEITSLLVVNNTLYVTVERDLSSSLCSQVAGSATGCEILVFDISSTTNPVYVAGRDVSGDSVGDGTLATPDNLITAGNTLYVSYRQTLNGVCSQVSGSATGCELQVFDISSTTNPVYVAGMEGSGSSTVADSVSNFYSANISGTALYIGKGGNTSACSQVPGSAIGCEILVFDISSTTNPVYVAGRDESGSATGTASLAIISSSINGSLLTIGKSNFNNNSTACSQVAGSATGCELMVFDISSTTNPVYVAGRDVSGSATGATAGTIYDIAYSRDTLIVGKWGNSSNNIPCSQVVGLAIGCELMLFDISSTTNPLYTHGFDGDGLRGGTTLNTIFTLLPLNNSIYIGKSGSTDVCSKAAGSAVGCEAMLVNLGAELRGNLTGSSALNSLEIIDGTVSVANTASTTDITIGAAGILVAPTTTLSVAGAYTNQGTFTHSSGTVIFSGTSAQVATGTMTGTSAFNNLTIANTSGNGSTTHSVSFGAPVTATGTFSMRASTSVEFLASSTNTFNNIAWQGSSATSSVWLRSSVDGQQWFLDVDGTKTVAFADIKDSNATSTVGGLTATNSFDSGNNTNWTFSEGSSLVIGDVGAGQITNQFTSQNKSDEVLFAFMLNPVGESATVTALTIGLSNIGGVATSELTDWRLYRDNNANRELDAGDVQVGGAGSFAIIGAVGSTTFSSSFAATTSRSYIVTADITSLERTDTVTLSLSTGDISAVGQTSLAALPRTGGVSSVTHVRATGGGGGDSGGGLSTDGAPGAGIVSGGAPDPGQELGDEPNFNPPTSNGTPHNEWISGANAYTSNNAYATETATNDRQTYGNYGYSIPPGNTITGIEVKIEASASTPAGTIQVALSWDGGNTITAPLSTATLTTTDTIYTLGGSSDLWGRGWSPSEFTNGNFAIRLIGQPSGGNTVQVDAIQVRVYHATTGGGGGGGTGEL